MRDASADEAGRLLDAARSAEARGRAAVTRPAWYPIGLGICTAVALAGFAVPGMATVGIVLGAIVLPVVLDLEARRRTGGSPIRDYFEAPTRGTALTGVVVGVAVAAASLVALKVTDRSWVVLPGALILGVGTVVLARRIEQLRVRRDHTTARQP